jgi:hypothetical protein
VGASKPPPAEFDLVGSFARCRGHQVEIILNEPAVTLSEASVVVTLAKGRNTVDAKGEVGEGPNGRRLTVRAPRAEFTDGIWSLTLHPDATTEEPVAARLLVQGQRPLVLLWGAKGRAAIVPARPRTVRRAAAKQAGRVLDMALTVLPDDKARQIRSQVRRTARKVLG